MLEALGQEDNIEWRVVERTNDNLLSVAPAPTPSSAAAACDRLSFVQDRALRLCGLDRRVANVARHAHAGMTVVPKKRPLAAVEAQDARERGLVPGAAQAHDPHRCAAGRHDCMVI